jgi:hypothetical protein
MKLLRSPMAWRYLAAIVLLGLGVVVWELPPSGFNWAVAIVGLAGAYDLAIAIALSVRRHTQWT